MADVMPDLSHLSEEERAIIEEVFQRQKLEEESETQIAAKADKELEQIEKQINEKKENARKNVGTQDDAICQICQVTKFADGIGHKCFYCQLRSCARCGGRTQSKGKVIWACSLCQKRQQILAKTGKWFTGTNPDDKMSPGTSAGPTPSTSTVGLEGESGGGMVPATTSQSIAASVPAPAIAPEAARGPRAPATAASQTRPNGAGPRNTATAALPQPGRQQHQVPAPGYGNAPIPQQQPRGLQQQPLPHQQPARAGGDMRRQSTLNRQSSQEASGERRMSNSGGDPNGTLPTGALQQRQISTERLQPRGGPERKRSGTMGERPVFYTDNDDRVIREDRRNTYGGGRGGELTIDQQYGGCDAVASSSGGFGRGAAAPAAASGAAAGVEFRRTRSIREDEQRRGSISARIQGGQQIEVAPVPPAHSGPPLAATLNTTPHTRPKKNRLHRQLRSMSSSDEEEGAVAFAAGSTAAAAGGGSSTAAPYRSSTSGAAAAGVSAGAASHEHIQRVPDECSSEKDLLRYIYGDERVRMTNRKQGQLERARSVEEAPTRRGAWPPAAASVAPAPDAAALRRRHPLPLAATVGRGIMPGELLAAKIRSYLAHPVTWQPSADQRRLIGHIILHRVDTGPSGDLGLKVVGGRRSDTGRLGAFITQVRPGSVADTVGRLRAGDEVLEWNGQVLQNATFDQVYEVISNSRHDQQVEIIVSRSAALPGGDDFLNMRGSSSFLPYSTSSPMGLLHQQQQQRLLPDPQLCASYGDVMAADSYAPLHSPPSLSPQPLPHSQSATLPSLQAAGPPHPTTAASVSPNAAVRNRSPQLYKRHTYSPLPQMMHFQRGQIFGRIEVALFYSLQDRQLTVKIIRAIDLPPRPDGVPRNPYCKVFLLPDRSEKSRRQSAVLAETNMPFWDESFFYHGLSDGMLLERVLEITLWDYDKYDSNSFLGEALVDFSQVPLDGKPLLYTLADMDEENPLRTRLRERRSNISMPRRPHSEMGIYPSNTTANRTTGGYRSSAYDNYGAQHHEYDENNGYIPPYGMPKRAAQPLRSVANPDDDWTMHANNQQSCGYLSDHGFAYQSSVGPAATTRHRHRRPRSATAMRPMMPEEMGASRAYTRALPHEAGASYYNDPDGGGGDMARLSLSAQPQQQQHQQQPYQSQPGNSYHQHQQQAAPPLHSRHGAPGTAPHHDPRSPNGRVVMQEAGYGSDGSETLSAHSNHSAPIVRTINRRRPPEERMQSEEMMIEEMEERRAANHVQENANRRMAGGGQSSSHSGGGAAASAAAAAAEKERKKSLMTRFIPGRNAGLNGKRTGFARSEEVGVPSTLANAGAPGSVDNNGSAPSGNSSLQPPFLKQTSKESTDSSHSDNWLPILPDDQLGSFVDNLGPGQVVGRQVLASPVLGEIQLALAASRSGIDVEVIRCQNLVVKPGKISPAPYVKVYLMEGKRVLSKAKTNAVRKSLNPLFQQHLIFQDSPQNKMLQVTVLGDYGRMERKAFMGVAQIRLDDLSLGLQPLIGLYKLFHSSSLAGTGPVRKDSESSLTAAAAGAGIN